MNDKTNAELWPGLHIETPPPGGNHGCRQYAIVKILSVSADGQLGYGRVTDAHTCTSCWQVGHGQDNDFWEVNDFVKLAAQDVTIDPESGFEICDTFSLLGYLDLPVRPFGQPRH